MGPLVVIVFVPQDHYHMAENFVHNVYHLGILLVGLVCASPGRDSSLVSFVVCFFFLFLARTLSASAQYSTREPSPFLEPLEGMLLDCQPYIEHSN